MRKGARIGRGDAAQIACSRALSSGRRAPRLQPRLPQLLQPQHQGRPAGRCSGAETRGDAALLRGATAEAGGDAWEAQDRPHTGSGSSSLAAGAQSQAQPVGDRLRCLPRAKKLLAGGVASPGVGGAPRLAERGGRAPWPRAGRCAPLGRWNPRLPAGAAVRTLAGTPATSAAQRAHTSRLCEQVTKLSQIGLEMKRVEGS